MLSIVLTGRNDDYGADFRTRFFRTLRFNHRELTARGVAHEFVLVEWAPDRSRPLLADLALDTLPDLDPASFIAYVVDGEYQDAMTLSPRVQYLEYIAKNVGLRRAAGDFVLSTNCDICLGKHVLSRLQQRSLERRTLYRALRYDLRLDLDTSVIDWPLLEDPASLHEMLKPLKPPLYAGGMGDFILLDRESVHALRGFNEQYRHARLGVDGTIVVKAYASGMTIADIGGPVYHLNHVGSHRLSRTLTPIPWADKRTGRGLLYENPPGWGLGDAPQVELGPRRWRIAFDWRAVPPLVDLKRILPPAAPPQQRRESAVAQS